MLTENETKVLRAIRHNFFVDGMPPTEAQIWSDCINDSDFPSGIEGKRLSGVVSSLVAKGLVWSDSECVGLTSAGAAIEV